MAGCETCRPRVIHADQAITATAPLAATDTGDATDIAINPGTADQVLHTSAAGDVEWVTPPGPVFGEKITDPTDIQATPSREWTAVANSDITLPGPGAYEISADVRTYINAVTGESGYIMARLFDVTNGAAIPQTARLLSQAAQGDRSWHNTGPVTTFYTANAPTTVRLEIARNGTSTAAGVYSDANGFTRIGYKKLPRSL